MTNNSEEMLVYFRLGLLLVVFSLAADASVEYAARPLVGGVGAAECGIVDEGFPASVRFQEGALVTEGDVRVGDEINYRIICDDGSVVAEVKQYDSSAPALRVNALRIPERCVAIAARAYVSRGGQRMSLDARFSMAGSAYGASVIVFDSAGFQVDQLEEDYEE